MGKPIVWSPSSVRAALARAGRPKYWLHEQMVERGAQLSQATLYNWLRAEPLGRPDDETVAIIRDITEELKGS